MVKRSSHRGPDGVGLCRRIDSAQAVECLTGTHPSDLDQWACASSVIMGHARLAILDVSDSSSQPFLSDSHRSALVFNGEIYNYRELRSELIEHGHEFRTTGDTEVLLKSLVQWGPAAVERLRGMYSFVFLDGESDSLLVSRDRYGIKPLYEWTSPEGVVYYASEIKQFVDLPGWDPIVNERVLSTFLSTGLTNYSEETFFQGVIEIEPGTTIRWDLRDGSTVRNVLKLRGFDTPCDWSFEEVLVQSVSLHLRSDVEVGSCLSGGMDSTALVAVATELLRESGGDGGLHVFTAASHDSDIDESPHARRVAECLGLTHSFSSPDESRIWSDIPSIIWHQDEPFPSASIVAQWSVFRLIGESGVKVVIDGQGADEILGGYDDYLAARFLDLLGAASVRQALDILKSYRHRGRLSLVRALRYRIACSRLLRNQYMMVLRFLLQPRVLRTFLNIVGSGRTTGVSPVPVHVRKNSYFNELREHQMRFSLRMLLRFEDRNSMAMSVESRVPFVDDVVIGAARSINPRELVTAETTKAVLRDALQRRLGPDCWDRTDKIGFAAAQNDWVQRYYEDVLDAISRLFSRGTGIDHLRARTMVSKMLKSRRRPSQIWRMYITAIWFDQFGVRFSHETFPQK